MQKMFTKTNQEDEFIILNNFDKLFVNVVMVIVQIFILKDVVIVIKNLKKWVL